MMAGELLVVGVLWVDAGRRMCRTGAHVVNVAALLHECKAYQVCQAKLSAADTRLGE